MSPLLGAPNDEFNLHPRRSKLMVPEGVGATPINALASLQKNLESLGFLLVPDVIERLKTLNRSQLGSFYERLVKDLQVLVSARRKFEPFYPNFPTQVMTTTEADKAWRIGPPVGSPCAH
jgi:hypothetical protein